VLPPFHHAAPAERWTGKIAPRPLFIIHGDLDQYGPDIGDQIKPTFFAQVWRVPDAGGRPGLQCPSGRVE